MNGTRLVRAELRKLATTKLLWGFLAATAVLSAFVLVGLLVGAPDGGQAAAALQTPPVQTNLLAFGTNALLLGGLFGAVAAAREYGHGTVVGMFLLAPRRHRPMVAKLVAVMLTGVVLGLVGGVLSLAAGAVALPLVGYELALSAGAMAQLVAGSALAGGISAVFGVGIGALIRNTGGAVTVVVVVLLLAPPLLGQLVAEADAWVPSTLVSVVSGTGDDPTLPAAVAALAAWGLVPATAGTVAAQRRDVL